MKIYLDPGHGGSDSGAVGNGLMEKDVMLELAMRIEKQLQRYDGVQIKMSRRMDKTKGLTERTNDANNWGAHLFLSLHCNAFNGKVRGYEDFIYNGLRANTQTARYRRTLHSTIVKRANIPNRGMKKANFHVLRESNMPAILTENGFIDHSLDAELMKNSNWLQQVAIGHVEGIVDIFHLKRKAATEKKYTVISGSFQKRANAEGRQVFLETHHIDSTIHAVNLKGKQFYRVHAGIFSNQRNARKRVKRIEEIGLDAFLL